MFSTGDGLIIGLVLPSERAKELNTLYFTMLSGIRKRRSNQTPCILDCSRAFGESANFRRTPGKFPAANSRQTPSKHPANTRQTPGPLPANSRQSHDNLPRISRQIPNKLPANSKQIPGKFPARSRQNLGKLPANSRQNPAQPGICAPKGIVI